MATPSFHGLTLRVYGWLENHQNQVLLSSEYLKGLGFTKFPGGGLEPGESLPRALQREFMEELGMAIQVEQHLHTTQELYESAFSKGIQVIAVYFKVTAVDPLPLHFPVGHHHAPEIEGSELFFWQPIAELQPKMLTFPTDQAFLKAMHKL
jgi:8-oxo-dGTP pyrophosphatase MutT (NUDIX family)